RRAKETLRDRLIAPGIAVLSLALDGALTASASSEIVPAALLASTAETVSSMSCGKLAARPLRAVRPRAVTLAKADRRAVLTAKLALTAVLLLGVSISVGAVTHAARTWGATPNLISIDVVDPQGIPVPGASVCSVVDGREELTTSDERGHCTVHRPNLKSS